MPASELAPRFRTSAVVLVVVNLVPLVMALAHQTDLFELLGLYWAESGVIGFYNALKLILIDRKKGAGLAIFFAVHFGIFMLVHGVFLVVFRQIAMGAMEGAPNALDLVAGQPWLLAAFFVSHGWSFFANFLCGSERHQRTVEQQMMVPYGRIVWMHLTILFGALPILALPGSAIPLALLVAAKTWVDLHLHRKQHAGAAVPA